MLQQHNFSTFTDYFHYIKSSRSEDAIVTLVDKITTNHTFFMRENKLFLFLKDKVLPVLAETVKDKDLRIWSAGCSSGEEPYTIAMLIDEFFGAQKLFWDAKLLATDISSRVLEMAIRGVYPNESVHTLPSHWRLNYLKSFSKDKSVIADKIRNEVIFRKLNLMEETFPFKKKFHVIFCRNVMIYFDAQTKMELVQKFYDLTEPGGYLFIGHSESLERDKTNYKYIMPSVYRKE